MRIEFQSDGGVGYFPGLDQPVTVDTDELPQAEAARFDTLVTAARFFERPPVVGAPAPGAADMRRYTIAIENGAGRAHRIEVSEPVEDASLQALIDALRGRAVVGDR